MELKRQFRFRLLLLILFLFGGVLAGFSGISREIQEQYRQKYENRAMYLMVPIYSERQFIYISGQSFRVERAIGSPRYKVGDQIRINSIDFGGDEIRFRLSGIEVAGSVEISFMFDNDLQQDFPNRAVFDKALNSTFTEGLSISDIENAQKHFVENEIEHSIGEIAASASVSRESVLESIAPHIPAYQKAQREIETLTSSRKAISDQLAESQDENDRLEVTLKTQESELGRLKKANAALQQDAKSSTSEFESLQEELRDVKGKAQEYQRELTKIESALNLETDAKRGLASQISSLANQVSSLQTNLKTQQETNARLEADNEELKATTRKLQRTVKSLTSDKGSLAKQYVDVKDEKEKLDELYKSMQVLKARIAEEKTEDGIYSGKANIYLKSVLLGSLHWSVPIQINHGQSKSAEAVFSAESIDYVRVTQEERQMLRSLGEKLKMRVDLTSESASMEVAPETEDQVRELGERDHATWLWQVSNQGAQDARLLITASLINQNSKEIMLFQQEPAIISTNIVRKVRNYLQPIPLVAGILIGFLLFGIVGVFRRPKKRVTHQKRQGDTPSEPPTPYVGQKKL
jgi:septal ring factor EnvC (AmiA/AmiB activator)